MGIKIWEEASIRGREHLPVDVLDWWRRQPLAGVSFPAADFLFLSLPHLHCLKAISKRRAAGDPGVDSVGLR